jgi:hypothetical protein
MNSTTTQNGKRAARSTRNRRGIRPPRVKRKRAATVTATTTPDPATATAAAVASVSASIPQHERKASIPPPDATSRYPYTVRGRCESAIFNCPRCNTWLQFKARTAFRKRCPTCGITIYVGLRVSVSSGQGGRRGDRPADTILPPVIGRGPRGEPRGTLALIDEAMELVSRAEEGTVETLTRVELGEWEPGEPFHDFENLDLDLDR